MGRKAAVRGGWHLSVGVNRKEEKQRKQQWGKKTGMSKGLRIKENLIGILGNEGSQFTLAGTHTYGCEQAPSSLVLQLCASCSPGT